MNEVERQREKEDFLVDWQKDKILMEKEREYRESLEREVLKEYLEDKIERLEIKVLLEEVNVDSVLTYMVFAADTIHEYIRCYGSRLSQHMEIGGAYEVNPPSSWSGGTMSTVLTDLWDCVHDMAKAVLERDATSALASLAWVNHLEHCSGGSILVDHGNMNYRAIDAISENGLEDVFGQASIDAFVAFIEA